MRRLKKRYIFVTILLAGIAILFAVRWHAWFDMPPEPKWEGAIHNYVFPSFEQDKTPVSFDMLVLGDIHNRLTRADYNRLAARVPEADVIVQTGDWMERGQNYYYQLLLQEWLPSRLCGLPVIATPGNHEYTKGLFKSCSDVWNYAFRYPKNGPEGVPGATYYIDLPQVRLISIDTNPLWRIVHLTRTLTWLRKTMNSAGDRYVVVLMHHPVVTAAKGRHNPLIYCTFRTALGDADLVIAGHDHSYMRKMPFVVLNTAGKTKVQHKGLTAQASDTIPVYSVISIPHPLIPGKEPQMEFKTYRLSDGVLIDSTYVSHH